MPPTIDASSAAAGPVSVPPCAAAAVPAQRVEHLFRLSSRQGRIHPLHALIERYRAGQAAAPLTEVPS